MLNLLIGFVTSIFTNSRASDTAIDVLRNVTGANDLTDKEKLEFVNQYIKNTAHQSPTRRSIAILTVVGMMTFTGTYLLVNIIESFYVFFSIDTTSLATAAQTENLAKIKVAPLQSLENDLLIMVKELKEPFMIVFGFYFFTQTAQVFKK